MSDHWINPRILELNGWLDAHSEVTAERLKIYAVSSFIDPPDYVWNHVSFYVFSTRPDHEEAEADCLNGASKCLEILAHGHRAGIRVRPEVETWRDFEKQVRVVRGYVRFSVSRDEGEWQYAMSPDNRGGLRYLNLPELK